MLLKDQQGSGVVVITTAHDYVLLQTAPLPGRASLSPSQLKNLVCRSKHLLCLSRDQEANMGKNQHSQDRMFITASEWKKQYGGHKTEKTVDARRE